MGSECWTKQEEHDVEDDVVECETIQDEKCEDETGGYTTFTKCSKWPREVCNVNRKSALWSPRGHAPMSPSWCPSWSPLWSVWMCPRRCAPGPSPTPGRSRSLLSRNGAMSPLRSLAWPK